MADVSGASCAAEIEIGYEHNDGTEHAQFHSEKRATQAAERRELADLQGRIADHLAAQTSGATSQRLIESHLRAKIFRHTVADGHEVKARAYETAAAIYTRYGSVKRDIITEAQKQIDQLQRSKAPAPVKAAQREAIIIQARADLGYAYAQAVANMAEAGQNILNKTGRGSTSIHDHVQPLGSGTEGGGGSHGPLPTGGPRIQTAAYGARGDKTPPLPPPIPDSVGDVVDRLVPPVAPAPVGPTPSAPAPSAPGSPAAPVPRVPSAPITSMASAPGGAAGGAGGRLPIPGLSPGGASAVSAAMSGVARAVPAVVVPPVVVAPHITGAAMPVSATAPVLDHGGLVSHAQASAPMPAAAPVPAPAAPVAPLPPYGSDVRMVASTSPASPPVAPPMSPMSEPGLATTPMMGPAMVRTVAAVTPAPAPMPSGQANASVVLGQTGAASFGAAAGSAAADSVAQARCDNFAAAMSGQEPRLRWMAATRADGVTVVATDLGGGWVPPGVGVPRSADLPAPGSLVSWRELQRGSVFHAAFTPGQDAAVATDSGAGVALGDGPRKLAPVSDLGWQLRQATQWRDGLPRVAHTLATAWTKGGGAMPAEMEQLQGALATQRETVLNDYARGDGEVDPHALGNWMLLSTIDAVHRNQMMLADYHFRWFGTTVRT